MYQEGNPLKVWRIQVLLSNRNIREMAKLPNTATKEHLAIQYNMFTIL